MFNNLNCLELFLSFSVCLKPSCIGDLNEHFTVYNGFCKQLELDANTESELYTLNIEYNKLFKKDLQIVIAEPEGSPYFMINPETLNGDIIKTQGFSTRVWSKPVYVVDLEEIQWLPDSGECMIYGNGADFKTYAECVANEHEKIFNPIMGCLPPWLAAPDNQGLCKGRVPIDERSFNQSMKIISSIFEAQGFNTMPSLQEWNLQNTI